MNKLEAARIMMEGIGTPSVNTVTQVINFDDWMTNSVSSFYPGPYTWDKIKIDIAGSVDMGNLNTIVTTAVPLTSVTLGQGFHGFILFRKNPYAYRPIYTYSGGLVNIDGSKIYRGGFLERQVTNDTFIQMYYHYGPRSQSSEPAWINYSQNDFRYPDTYRYHKYDEFIGSRYIGGLIDTSNEYTILGTGSCTYSHSSGSIDVGITCPVTIRNIYKKYHYFEDPEDDYVETVNDNTFGYSYYLYSPWFNYNWSPIWIGSDLTTYRHRLKLLELDIKLNQPVS